MAWQQLQGLPFWTMSIALALVVGTVLCWLRVAWSGRA
jgi:hypothetical protein